MVEWKSLLLSCTDCTANFKDTMIQKKEARGQHECNSWQEQKVADAQIAVTGTRPHKNNGNTGSFISSCHG